MSLFKLILYYKYSVLCILFLCTQQYDIDLFYLFNFVEAFVDCKGSDHQFGTNHIGNSEADYFSLIFPVDKVIIRLNYYRY